MLTPRAFTAQRGFTLTELLVAMIVAGVVLALLTLTALHQQRLLGDLLEDAALTGQLREAAALVPIDLRALSVGGGDLREARDTALELRNTIASGVVCDTAGRSIVLAPVTAGADTYTSYTTSIEPGDTVWLYTPGDLADGWLPRAVTSIGTAAPGQCRPGAPTLALDVAARARTAITLDSTPGALAIGAPLRVTRPVRLSLYRSADGTWNLGERDWNPSLQRFNSIQPLAGPFLSAAAAGLTFAYLDSARAELPTPVENPAAAAAIAVTLRGETRTAVRALGSASHEGTRLDSARLVILLRNRR